MQQGAPPLISGAGLRFLFWALAALVVAIPTVTLPNEGMWLGVKAFALEAVGIALAVFIVSRGEWSRERIRAAFTAAPNIAIMALLVWVGVSAALSDLPTFSRFEAMRHLGGALIYFCVVYGLSVRRQLGYLVLALLAAGSLAAVVGLAQAESTEAGRLEGAFHNGELMAGFLALLLPLALMASQTDESGWRRTAIQATVVIIGAGILVTRNRSAWAGTAVALLLMGILYLRYGRQGYKTRLQKHQVLVPVVMVALILGLFLGLSRMGGDFSRRAGTLTSLQQDNSFKWRLGMWDKALRMMRDRPLMGWGVGNFRLQQALYFHPDAPSRQQKTIRRQPSDRENAHNSFLQAGAELGIPGLLLFVSLFGAFFVTALGALPRMRPGFRQAMLIASIAAVGGQVVTSFGNPSLEFAECSLFFWLVLGIGMATAGVGERGRSFVFAPPPSEK